MDYKELDKDFIRRTKLLIEQYKHADIPASQKYEITLLINCLYGLIILPKAVYFNEFKEDRFKISNSRITIKLNDNEVAEIKTKDLFHCLRNGLAHWCERGIITNIRFKSREDGMISGITLKGTWYDKVLKKETKVEVNLPDVESIEIFVDLIIDKLEYIMDK